MVSQTNNVWGRDDSLSPNDTVTVNTLVYQNKELKQQPGNTLTVAEGKPVTLKRTCDASKATIVAAYYGNNGQREFDTLCDNKGLANCFCQATDFNPALEGDEGYKKLNMKSGIFNGVGAKAESSRSHALRGNAAPGRSASRAPPRTTPSV